jgi:hypothetical protein
LIDYLYAQPNIILDRSYTIFTVLKPFVGQIGIIQSNAITSWTKLIPPPEIILFGDVIGAAQLAQKLGLSHIRQIRVNEYGTPLLGDIFATVRDRAKHNLLVYVNADIILMNDFSSAVQTVAQQFRDFLIIGRRWNLDIKEPLEFQLNWQQKLKQLVAKKGCLAKYDCKDYFVFPKHLFISIPQFAVGRGYWDTWMVNYALAQNYPVVDISESIVAIHQNHSYNHIKGGKNEAYMGKEAQLNQAIGKLDGEGNIASATWLLQPDNRNLPHVSVAIVIDDRAINLEKTLRNIFEQPRVKLEVVLVNRSSVPGIQAILEAYRHKAKLVSIEAPGLVYAYNRALEVAGGKFVLFLPNNAILLPGQLAKQVALFDREASTLDLLLSGWQTIEGNTIIYGKPWEDIPHLDDLHIWMLDLVWQPLAHSIVMFRRSRLQSIGGFNERLGEQFAILEAIITLVVLKGSRAMWLEEASCCYLEQQQTQEIQTIKKSLKQALDSIFNRPEIAEWMLMLKDRAYRAISH